MTTKIGDYGKMIFEQIVGRREGWHGTSPRWESIRAEAEPLLYALIELNDKMVDEKGNKNGYCLCDYVTKDGKPVLSEFQRMTAAQTARWSVPIETLKQGDRIFFSGGGREHKYSEYDDPLTVEFVNDWHVYIDMGDNEILKLYKSQTYIEILKVADDWDDNGYSLYSTAKYWLEQADELGI